MVGMRSQDATDVVIAHLAARQHGVVSVRQLRAAGLTSNAITRRLRSGRLHRIHRGVYAVGHTAPSNERRWMAAALAYGSDAVVSHRSAASLWGLLAPRSEPVHVSVSGIANKGKHKGVQLHRSRTLTPEQTTRRRGIPVTTPTRTIADLRRVAPVAEVQRALRQAGVLGFRVDDESSLEGTRSALEQAFLRICERYGLPRPEVNAHVSSLDVVRLTYRQVIDEPERVAAALKHR